MKTCDNKYKEAHEKQVALSKEVIADEKRIEKMCSLLKVLSEPSRMKIVLTLLQGEACVYHIVEAVDGNQSAVSHQIRILKDSGAIKARREGQNILYSIADSHVEEIVEVAKTHAHCLEEGER